MVNHKIPLSYKNIYDENFGGSLEDLFKGVDQEFAFNLVDIINRNVENYQTTTTLINYLRDQWFSDQNAEKFLWIEDRILHFSRQPAYRESEILIFNAHATLAFTETLISYIKAHEQERIARPSNQQMEVDLLNAYLVINQQLNRSENGNEAILADFPSEHLSWLVLYKPFQSADLINRNMIELFITESVKAIMLFEFLEANDRARPILAAFLAKYNCGDWREYLRAISGMTVTGLNTPNHVGNSLVHIDPELPFYDTCILILDKISVDVGEAIIEKDFLYLRNHPIHRTGHDKFQILSQRFFLEKIFRALYFELRATNLEIGAMSDDKFRTHIYTTGYSENKLFYSVLNKIFYGASQKIEGIQMEASNPAFGATDYITSYRENIYLFESKDILIRKEVKDRLYLPEMREEFRKKFYKDGNSDKAVLQLARNIKKLLDGGYEQFGFSLTRYRFIYPVLVVHSDAFDILGINQIIYQWFKEACTEVGIEKRQVYKIKPVVIIDISTLLYFQEHLNKKHVHLNELIDSYLSRTTIPREMQTGFRSAVQYQSRYMISFSHYVNHTIRRIKRFRNGSSFIRLMKEFLIPKARME